MKFQVKVGRKFEGEIVVTVSESAPKRSFAWKAAAAAVVVTLIASASLIALAYGAATGDYSLAKSIANTTLEILARFATKVKE